MLALLINFQVFAMDFLNVKYFTLTFKGNSIFLSVKFHFFLPCAKYFDTNYKFERSHSYFKRCSKSFLMLLLLLPQYLDLFILQQSSGIQAIRNERSPIFHENYDKIICLGMVLWLVNWLV